VAEFWKLRVQEEQRFDRHAFGDDEADVEDSDSHDSDGDVDMRAGDGGEERKRVPKKLRKRKGGEDGRAGNKGSKTRKQYTYARKAAVIDAYDHAVSKGTSNAQGVIVEATGIDQSNVSKWINEPQRVRFLLSVVRSQS
jgi:hypothetical protein